MADSIRLLSDEEVQRFIVDGCLAVQADYPPSFHASIRDQIEAVFAAEGNPGNNILPRVPQIGRVFEHPNVKGALTSLLGPDYILKPPSTLPLESARATRTAMAQGLLCVRSQCTASEILLGARFLFSPGHDRGYGAVGGCCPGCRCTKPLAMWIPKKLGKKRGHFAVLRGR